MIVGTNVGEFVGKFVGLDVGSEVWVTGVDTEATARGAGQYPHASGHESFTFLVFLAPDSSQYKYWKFALFPISEQLYKLSFVLLIFRSDIFLA